MFGKCRALGPLGVVIVCCANAGAQNNVVVQLPTFHRFSMSTTVLVPDGGAVYLGGVGSGRQSARTVGPPLLPLANRSRGSQVATSGVSVRAWIQDLNELDEAVLAEWEKRKASSAGSQLTSTTRERSARLPRSPDPPSVSLRDLRASRHARQETKRRQSADDYQKALDMEAKGKLGVARIYYGMALRNAAGPLRDEIESRMERAELGRGIGVTQVR